MLTPVPVEDSSNNEIEQTPATKKKNSEPTKRAGKYFSV